MFKFLLYGNAINKIKNFTLPECKSCKYFIPNKTHSSEEQQINYGRCGYFGEKNVVSGELEYKYASICRISGFNYCGEHGKYYSPKEFTSSEDI